MAFTRFEIDTANISKLSDRPNQNDGLSAAQLKGRFDKAGVDIKDFINDVLIEELESDSGADNIGATAVGDGTATTVQGILEEIDADVTALDGAVVHKTGNETIAGVKTFTDSPIVPAPTADTNPATKKYVDDIASARYTKTNLQTEGQALVHWGNLTNVPNLADAHWKTPVATKSALPVTGNSLGDNRVVLDDGDGKQAVYTCVATTGTYIQQWSKVGDVDWMTEEATRQTQEIARVNAEELRAAAETARKNAENERASTFSGYDNRIRTIEDGESTRVQSESIRASAEQARVNAENARSVFEVYNPGKSYVVGNKVYYLGSSYRCIKNSSGIAPTNTECWMIIARKGEVYFPTFSVDENMQLIMHDDFNYDGTISFRLNNGYLIQEVV